MDSRASDSPTVSRTLKKLAAKLRKAVKKNRMTVRYMFKAMDADGNGLLSAEELRVGLQPYVPKVELGVDVMNDIIAFVDKDGDNEVTFDEFDLALKALDEQRKDRVEKRIEKKGDSSVGFPKHVNNHGSKITRSLDISSFTMGSSKKNKKDKLSGKGSGGRVIMDDDPTPFWLDKKVVNAGVPNLTKRPKRKKPIRNDGSKTPSYKYRKPRQSLYPSMFTHNDQTTKMVNHNSKPNILGRIESTNQPRIPSTIASLEGHGMETLLRQMSASTGTRTASTGGAFSASNASFLSTPPKYRQNSQSPIGGNSKSMKTMADSWNSTWNTYTAVKVDNPLISMRGKRRKKKRKLTELEKLQIIAEKLYDFEEAQNAEEMNTSLENMFAFSFKSNPVAQNGRPITTHDGAVQLHVASEWKKGQVGAIVLLKRFRRSALLRNKLVRDKLMNELPPAEA
eukprot:g742.t1